MDSDGTRFAEISETTSFLHYFSGLPDHRQAGKVDYPLPEVLLLILLAVLAGAEAFTDIARFGERKIELLRRFRPYVNGTPSHDHLGDIFATLDAHAFQICFVAWVAALTNTPAEVIAIDGKTSRRSHDRRLDKGPLHLVSAFASASRLVLGQEAVDGKSNELSAIPVLLERLAGNGGLKGALVSIDAIATNAKIAQAILDADADYLLAVKANQPTLRAEIESAFEIAEPAALDRCVDVDKGHGRIEHRTVTVMKDVDWLGGDRRFPGEFRLPRVKCVIRVESRAELADRSRFETRYYISSAALVAERAAAAVRGHWAIENQLHWVLDVDFGEDMSRLRKGHGATNMAIVRHFAINLVRAVNDKRTLKLRRKAAGWSPDYLAQMLGATLR